MWFQSATSKHFVLFNAGAVVGAWLCMQMSALLPVSIERTSFQPWFTSFPIPPVSISASSLSLAYYLLPFFHTRPCRFAILIGVRCPWANFHLPWHSFFLILLILKNIFIRVLTAASSLICRIFENWPTVMLVNYPLLFCPLVVSPLGNCRARRSIGVRFRFPPWLQLLLQLLVRFPSIDTHVPHTRKSNRDVRLTQFQREQTARQQINPQPHIFEPMNPKRSDVDNEKVYGKRRAAFL